MQTIQCPFCSSQVEAADVNLALVLAKCRTCRAVFQFGEQVSKNGLRSTDDSDDDDLEDDLDDDFDDEGRSRPAALIDLPKGLRDTSSASELLFSMSWYNSSIWGLAIFATLWDGFMIVWYAIAIAQGEWMMALFGVLHLSVGVGLTYGVAVTVLNSSWVRVDAYSIDVRHGPLPYSGRTSIPAGDVEQLFVARTSSASYELHAVLQNGSTQKILNVNTIDQGHYLEQRIEAFLNIVDRPVKGEA